MLVSLLQANVVSFYVTSKYKKIQNIDKIADVDREILHIS